MHASSSPRVHPNISLMKHEAQADNEQAGRFAWPFILTIPPELIIEHGNDDNSSSRSRKSSNSSDKNNKGHLGTSLWPRR